MSRPGGVLDLFDLSGRVALVTGGAGLLGSEYCRGLAECGASAVAADVNARVEAPRVHGAGSIEECAADVSDRESVRALVADIVQRYGRLDILVNNAATKSPNFFAPFEEFPLEDWQRVMDVNLTGMFLCAQAVGPRMLAQGRGAIVNVCSIYGLVGPDQRVYGGSSINTPAIYSVTKAGVLGLTRYLAAYWGGRGIRVNSLSPGGVQTDQDKAFVANYSRRTPMGRMARRDEMTAAVLYLVSDASSYVNGHNLVVDGGWTAW